MCSAPRCAQPFVLAGGMQRSLTELNLSQNNLSGALPLEVRGQCSMWL